MTINNRSSSIRRSSATLSTFPWATDFLVQDTENILSEEYYLVRLHHIYTFHYLTCRLKPFVQAVDELESSIDTSPADDNDAHRLQVVLSRVVPGSDSLPAPPTIKKPLTMKLCEIICSYKLMDVLYDLQEQDRTTPFENPAYPKQRLHAFLPPSQVTCIP